jgi:hypothetical protein
MEKAGSRNRTDDLLITNQLLYQLSYAGEGKATRLTTLKRKGQKAIVTFATLQPFGRARPIIRGRGSTLKGGPPFPNS